MEPHAYEFDLLLKGGHVIDPANGVDGPADIGIRAGKVAAVGQGLRAGQAAAVIEAGGLYITPGLIDLHTHVYPFQPTPTCYVEAVRADAHLFTSGVTTTVDAGTAGWRHFLDFKEKFIDRSPVRILAFLNIASGGMVDTSTEQNPAQMQPKVAAALVDAYPDVLVGIKSAHYRTREPFDSAHHPWASVERAIEAAELCGRPVMVDFWPRLPERPYSELILRRLRPGDIHTHVFAQQFPVISPEGRVNGFYFEARERGIRFDLGHGAASFWFRNAAPAIRQGFSPDTLSTDLHMGNINGPVLSMQNTLSKLLNLGMPLAEVIERSTALPARVIGRPELGTLAPGAEADLAAFRLRDGQFGFTDCGRARLAGRYRLECELTLRAGAVVFDPSGLSMPDWEHAPAPYWNIPALEP